MADAALAFTIFDRLLAVLGLIRDKERLAEKREDEALEAVYAALVKTNSYLADRAAGKKRDRRREETIAGLWHRASIPLHHIDSNFAVMCMRKGGYWMQPEAWTEEAVEAQGIKIEQVMKETERLLAKRKRS